MEHKDIIDFVEREFKIKAIEKEGFYIMPTICHNLDSLGASHKLYLYKNENSGTPIFYCYTDCGEGFNIYQLIQKYHSLRGEEISFRDAYKKFHGQDYEFKTKEKRIELLKSRSFENPELVELPEYSENILKIFKAPNIKHPWFLEGVDLSVLKEFEIFFSLSYEGVIIPHRDYRGRLVGIRLRTYDEEKVKQYKYMPLFINNTYYRHPLSLNFFGLLQNQENIIRAKRAILVESEKAVLQAESMLGRSGNITLAVCGSSISSWQLDMLVHYLKIDELVIGFDKEYTNFDEWFNYKKKIKNQLSRVNNIVSTGILYDNKNLFRHKDSPFDRTLKDFTGLSLEE